MRRSISPDSPPQSPIYPATPPALPHMQMDPRSTPSPSSKLPLRELSSPSAPLSRPGSFPSPPTGHELMLMFPPPAPSLKDVDIVAGVDRPYAEHQNRSSAFQDEVRARLLGGTYVNTSTWFGKEERAFFAARERSGSVPASTSSTDGDASPPAKRRKSLDSESSYPYPRPTLRLSPARHASPQHHMPPPPPAHASPTPPSHTSPPQTQAQIPPPTFPALPPKAGGPRRRAGKYTRRVFVHPPGPGTEEPAMVKWARG